MAGTCPTSEALPREHHLRAVLAGAVAAAAASRAISCYSQCRQLPVALLQNAVRSPAPRAVLSHTISSECPFPTPQLNTVERMHMSMWTGIRPYVTPDYRLMERHNCLLVLLLPNHTNSPPAKHSCTHRSLPCKLPLSARLRLARSNQVAAMLHALSASGRRTAGASVIPPLPLPLLSSGKRPRAVVAAGAAGGGLASAGRPDPEEGGGCQGCSPC